MTPSERKELDDAWTKAFYPAKCPRCSDAPMELNGVSHGCQRWHCAACGDHRIRWAPEPGCEAPALVLGADFDFFAYTVRRPRKLTVLAAPVGDIRVTADPTLKPGEFVVGDIRCLGGGAFEYMTERGWRPHVGIDLGFAPVYYGRRHGKREHQRNMVRTRIESGESVSVVTPSGVVDGKAWLDVHAPDPALFSGVDRSAPVQSLKVTARLDGFDQGRIDAIKADMLAVGRRR